MQLELLFFLFPNYFVKVEKSKSDVEKNITSSIKMILITEQRSMKASSQTKLIWIFLGGIGYLALSGRIIEIIGWRKMKWRIKIIIVQKRQYLLANITLFLRKYLIWIKKIKDNYKLNLISKVVLKTLATRNTDKKSDVLKHVWVSSVLRSGTAIRIHMLSASQNR